MCAVPAREIAYDVAALDGLERLPKKTRRQVIARCAKLASNCYPAGSIKLKGQENVLRVRQGDYRILYQVRDDEVRVLHIEHRKDVYR